MSDSIIDMTGDQWEAFLANLYERDDRLAVREPGGIYPPEEAVDPYVLSGHAEALRSAEVEGDVWGTLADLEEEAGDEEEAWAKVVAFYLDRGCVLLRVTDAGEPEEWLLEEGLARRLGLPGRTA
ncbi:hypothetical protein E5F05_15345 [Deinococcus metallilatus]|uniref:Uncharacterized protein n=1 Tax=Deinococcus metallilatus TaxID=1211322 RepID=A0AAJ5F1D9_9DEIO|nr:hypothetical protein [Deinococcus metallilatus]MBB5296715.1 hypothetical protein [Deinococcus metallilatus]QBY09205.1 hypothetical protein E5F05_15345 [Deinococcus metallilatus]RXJ09723.1 hypothetical protein ERJ73_14175 [Deinococcus metallilatus]TLK24189.1 hypothetical protein FCS05_15135 [Deinococcus metallilatus]GMA13746.1 hypothetical protein GCM10025871_00770 [Deinococcus metallilatus]